ncbi:MAG: hypothetical protein IID46_10715 [Planctomycetes bacterium]|nr:hypothetical protein [Planctomycetota bacterium]
MFKTAELKAFELYNIKKDIGETTDLSSREPERLEDMATALNKMYHEVRDESPTWPAWTSPRIEGKRIRKFYEAEKALTEENAKIE